MYVVFDVGGTQTRLGYSANGRSLVRVETRPTDASEAGLGAFAAELAKVRAEVERRLHPTGQPHPLNLEAELTGVGFFGMPGKDSHRTPTNGARLFPVTSLRWDGRK